MDEDVVIKVDNVSKKFTRSIKRSMLYGSSDLAKGVFGRKLDTLKLRKGEFWSLRDVSFELKKGEGLGIIGRNGSGKSTLLRLINGIFPPDQGSISVKGKIGALIAVGAGFHPHMTGRENIYLNGTILGMSKEEIDEKFNSIIEFADIGEFIDAPVSTYSSGMTVRLGFAIAIHSEPDILLADEVLAVGDLQFALKCHRRIAEYRKAGGTIILVSHGMQQIRNVCNHVLWLQDGSIKEYGDANDVCDHYENFILKQDLRDNTVGYGTHINNDPDTQITSVEFLDKHDKKAESFQVGGYLKAKINYTCKRKVSNPIFTFGVSSIENIGVLASFSNLDNKNLIDNIEGEGSISIVIENLYLKPGSYRCTFTLAEDDIENVLDWHEKNFTFIVESSGNGTHGLLQVPIKWEV